MNVGVLASGTGTNLQALLDTVHGNEVDIVGVVSDKAGARALQRAEEAGVETAVFLASKYSDRVAHEGAIADWLLERDVELVVLAGYMTLLGPAFLVRFEDHVINVHPSVLPAFPGLDAIQQALDYGSRVFGVTVHMVDEGVDSGPIILQGAIEIDEPLSADEVHSALRPTEHRLLPEAVRLMAAGQITRDPGNPRRLHIAPRVRD